MSTHKTVYNKLFSKQELSTQKVHLALIDGIGRDLDKLGDDWVRAEGILSK
jgi:hypothetical protein